MKIYTDAHQGRINCYLTGGVQIFLGGGGGALVRYQRGCSGSDPLKTHCIDRFQCLKVFMNVLVAFLGYKSET